MKKLLLFLSFIIIGLFSTAQEVSYTDWAKPNFSKTNSNIDFAYKITRVSDGHGYYYFYIYFISGSIDPIYGTREVTYLSGVEVFIDSSPTLNLQTGSIISNIGFYGDIQNWVGDRCISIRTLNPQPNIIFTFQNAFTQ